DTSRFPEYLQHIARYYSDHEVRAKLADLCQLLSANPATQLSYYLAVKKGHDQRGAPLPSELRGKAIELCTAGLAANDGKTVQNGRELATSLRAAELYGDLAKLAAWKDRADGQRAAALQALAAIDAGKAQPILIKVMKNDADPIGLREKSAQILAGSNRNEALD